MFILGELVTCIREIEDLQQGHNYRVAHLHWGASGVLNSITVEDPETGIRYSGYSPIRFEKMKLGRDTNVTDPELPEWF